MQILDSFDRPVRVLLSAWIVLGSIATRQPDQAARWIATADSLAAAKNPQALRRSIGFRDRASRHLERSGRLAEAATEGEKIATAWLDLKRPTLAGPCLARAVRLRRLVGDSAALAKALRLQGAWHTEMGAPRRALAPLREAWAIGHQIDPVEAAQVAFELGAAHYELDSLELASDWMDSSSSYFERGGDGRSASRSSNLAANIADEMEASERVVRAASRALRLAREAGDLGRQADALALLGLQAGHRGAIDTALLFGRNAAEAYRQVGDLEGQGNALSNLGVVFVRLGLADSARAHFERALTLADSAGDFRTRALVLGNLAGTIEETIPADSAVKLHQASLDAARAVGDESGQFAARLGLARALAARSPPTALRLERAALAAAHRQASPIRIAVALHALGQSLAALGKTDSAVRLLRQAQRRYHALDEPLYLAEALTDLARADRARGQWRRAVALFDSAAAQRSRVGSRTGADFVRLGFEETGFGLFGDWVAAILEIGGPMAPAASLGVLERGRAQALRDLMSDAPPAVVAPGGDLASEASQLLDRALGRDQGALIYLVGPLETRIWFRAPNGGLTVRSVEIGADSLTAAIEQLRAALGIDATGEGLTAGRAIERGVGPRRKPASDSLWRSISRGLADLLVPAAFRQELQSAREVIVIPDGAIAVVPFAALPLAASGAEPARWAFRYAPSLATLAAANERPRPGVTSPLVIGNPEMPDLAPIGLGTSLIPLPGAESEAAAIAAKLGTRALIGPAATESEFVTRARGASVIHLATHGFAFSSPAQARHSFVALARAGQQDGLLQVGELLDDPDRRFVADLVVLSACQTGLGNLRKAEGTVGLQRAFLAKGARSVLVSLWNVDDRATSRLMELFYSHWLDDPDRPTKAEALRRAQAAMASSPEWQSPRFWAAFQLVGAS